MSEIEPFIAYKNCTGILSHDGNSIETSFDLTFSKNGKIQIFFNDQKFDNNTSWIYFASNQKTETTATFSLEGKTQDHFSLVSDSVWLTESNITSTPQSSALKIQGTAGQIDLQKRNDDSLKGDIEVQFWIAGLKCFGSLEFKHGIGKILVRGNHAIKDFSEICGVCAIRKHLEGKGEYSSWFESVKEQSRRILDLLSFANGRFLQTNLIRVVQDEQLTSITLFNKTSHAEPYKPTFSHLNLQPFVKTGLEKYDQNFIDKTGFNVALEWFLMPHRYNESRYLAQMTALEHLIHVYVEQQSSNRMFGKAEFKKQLRPALEKTIEDIIPQLKGYSSNQEHYETLFEDLKRKIGDLNRRSLWLNLNSMLSLYRVPLNGLNDFLPELIKIRNQIVHRGFHEQSSDQKSLGKYLSALEELLKRIFLSLLDFRGQRRTFFNEIEFKDFERLPLN